MEKEKRSPIVIFKGSVASYHQLGNFYMSLSVVCPLYTLSSLIPKTEEETWRS